MKLNKTRASILLRKIFIKITKKSCNKELKYSKFTGKIIKSIHIKIKRSFRIVKKSINENGNIATIHTHDRLDMTWLDIRMNENNIL